MVVPGCSCEYHPQERATRDFGKENAMIIACCPLLYPKLSEPVFMLPFIEKLAIHLNETYGENLSRLCIVFPNRRAGLFLRQYLSRLIDKPLWLPEIYALEDFVVARSTFQVPDSLSLLVRLYRIYQEAEQKNARPFSEFLSWGNILLADFDEIDQNLADGEGVFRYLDELKALRHWNPDGTPLTEFEKDYLSFYNSLAVLYRNFRESLLGSGQGYTGLAYKVLAENLTSADFSQWEKVLFAGFNALTTGEERLITHLIESGIGEVYWDADRYYMEDERQEAGYFLRSNFKKSAFSNSGWIGDELLTGSKEISVIGVPGNIGQAKLAGQLCQDLIRTENPSDVAMILVDESLMLPVMNSIPRELDHFNITMGYPLILTPVYSLIDAILRLWTGAGKYKSLAGSEGASSEKTKFHFRDVDRLIKHPYIARFAAIDSVQSGKQADGRFYLLSDMLIRRLESGFPALAPYFIEVLQTEQVQPSGVIRLIELLLEACRKDFLATEENGTETHVLDIEYLYHAARLIEQVKPLAEPGLINDIATLHEVLKSQVASTRLPFYGEPLKGLQVMGVLETRALDFKNIIMLSVNEGMIPKARHQNTFIPDEVRKEYGLHRYRERNAVFAYHFYRLLQRAENIFLLYNTEGGELGGGERSRFITQLLYESRINPGIHIRETILPLPLPIQSELPVSIAKNDNIMEKLHEVASRGFSPTALGSYLACSLQFCYSHVLGIRESEEPEESIDAATLGEVVHKVLQDAYTPFLGKHLTAEDLKSAMPLTISSVKAAFEAKYASRELESGKNLLVLKVAEGMIRRFMTAEIDYLRKLPGNRKFMEILHLESDLSREFEIIDKQTGELIPVKIRGIADRIDKVDGQVRVIDYKTGIVQKQDVKLDDVSLLPEHGNPSKLLQLLAYAWMYLNSPDNKSYTGSITSGIISLRYPSQYMIPAIIGGKQELDAQMLQGFEEVLAGILEDIFDRERDFIQTEDKEICRNCPYQTMCNRLIN